MEIEIEAKALHEVRFLCSELFSWLAEAPTVGAKMFAHSFARFPVRLAYFDKPEFPLLVPAQLA